MVRFPAGWGQAFHPQASRRGVSQLSYVPGYKGSGMQPVTRIPVEAYTRKIQGVDLTGGQVLGTVPASGKLTLSVGPQGLGTVWYPAQVTLSTTTGALDVSTALCYLGVQGVLNQLVGTVYTGNGTVALAIPSMAPGQLLIVQWTGAHPGDQAAANMTGTMDALSPG
jgi:hypothetical protein